MEKRKLGMSSSKAERVLSEGQGRGAFLRRGPAGVELEERTEVELRLARSKGDERTRSQEPGLGKVKSTQVKSRLLPEPCTLFAIRIPSVLACLARMPSHIPTWSAIPYPSRIPSVASEGGGRPSISNGHPIGLEPRARPFHLGSWCHSMGVGAIHSPSSHQSRSHPINPIFDGGVRWGGLMGCEGGGARRRRGQAS